MGLFFYKNSNVSNDTIFKNVQGDTKFSVAYYTKISVSIATFFNCFILLRSSNLVLNLFCFLIFLKSILKYYLLLCSILITCLIG